MLGSAPPTSIRQQRRRRSRRLAGPLFGALLAAAGLADAQTPAAPPTAPAIDGFREAHFGMTEAQVRQAIRTDFPKAAGPVAVP